MIEVINENILDIESGIICQQVNCRGNLSEDLALQLSQKYPTVLDDYQAYINNSLVDEKHSKLLGDVLKTRVKPGLIVASIFGQDDYGCYDKRYTNYSALVTGLAEIYSYALFSHTAVYIPYGIGCGLSGGDWNIVKLLIEDIFLNTTVKCYICKLENN